MSGEYRESERWYIKVNSGNQRGYARLNQGNQRGGGLYPNICFVEYCYLVLLIIMVTIRIRGPT